MYQEFYRCREEPFRTTPDPEFVYWSQKHQDALKHLLYGIHTKKGLSVLTGEIGTGKTTLINTLRKKLSDKTHIAYITNTTLETHELFQYIFQEFDIHIQAKNKIDYLFALKKFLIESSQKNELVIIICDESQNCSIELLEEIRLLTNIETEKSKLINIILVGQTSLLEKINSPKLVQLRQRVGIIYHLSPLNRNETHLYIQKRLKIAGCDTSLFSREAIDKIFAYSKGIPRVINIVCENALLFGAAQQSRQMNVALIEQVLQSLSLPPFTAPEGDPDVVHAGGGDQAVVATQTVTLSAQTATLYGNPAGLSRTQRAWLTGAAVVLGLGLLGVWLLKSETGRHMIRTLAALLERSL
jgi:general secretion pathway protein A